MSEVFRSGGCFNILTKYTVNDLIVADGQLHLHECSGKKRLENSYQRNIGSLWLLRLKGLVT